MPDRAKAREAAQELRESAAHLDAAVRALAAGGAPHPVVQHLRAATTSVKNTATMLEQA